MSPMPSTVRTTRSARWWAVTSAWPSSTFAPAARATSSNAASRSCRRATAANSPLSRGSGNTVSRPDGDRTTTSCTGCHDATDSGRSPSASSARNADAVNPSPQHLSRGNRARSTTTTSRPARARVIAAAAPAGPPPTTTTSVACTTEDVTGGVRLRVRRRRAPRVPCRGRATVPGAVLHERVAGMERDLRAVVELADDLAGKHHLEVDGVGGVHAGVVRLHVRGHARQLLVHRGEGRGDVEVGRDVGTRRRHGEDPEAEPTGGREVGVRGGGRAVGGELGHHVGAPQAVELVARQEREGDRVDLLVGLEHGLAARVLPGHHTTNLRHRFPLSRDARVSRDARSSRGAWSTAFGGPAAAGLARARTGSAR